MIVRTDGIRRRFAETAWTVDDIDRMSLRDVPEHWGNEEKEAFLRIYEESIRDTMHYAVWDALEVYISEYLHEHPELRTPRAPDPPTDRIQWE